MLEASKTVGSGRLYHGPVRAKTGKGVIWVGGRHFRDAWLLAAHSPCRRRAAGQPLDRRDSHARGQLERNPALSVRPGLTEKTPLEKSVPSVTPAVAGSYTCPSLPMTPASLFASSWACPVLPVTVNSAAARWSPCARSWLYWSRVACSSTRVSVTLYEAGVPSGLNGVTVNAVPAGPVRMPAGDGLVPGIVDAAAGVPNAAGGAVLEVLAQPVRARTTAGMTAVSRARVARTIPPPWRGLGTALFDKANAGSAPMVYDRFRIVTKLSVGHSIGGRAPPDTGTGEVTTG